MKVVMRTPLLRQVKRVLRKLRGGSVDAPKTSSPAQLAGLPVFAEVRQELLVRGDQATLLDPVLIELAAAQPAADRHVLLKSLLSRHPKPHQVNYLLGQEEYRRGVAEMAAYPTYVLMDISNIC